MNYTLIRSNRRTLALEINREGQLVVRAPRNCSLREIDRILHEREAWICENMAREARRNASRPEPDGARRAELLEQARIQIPSRVAYYSHIMGLRPSGVAITDARTRFGSCSAQNSLCFSWRLMDYPLEAVDYVVVHELAHIAHKNHGPQFYALVASVLPDYEERRELLR